LSVRYTKDPAAGRGFLEMADGQEAPGRGVVAAGIGPAVIVRAAEAAFGKPADEAVRTHELDLQIAGIGVPRLEADLDVLDAADGAGDIDGVLAGLVLARVRGIRQLDPRRCRLGCAFDQRFAAADAGPAARELDCRRCIDGAEAVAMVERERTTGPR